MKTITLLQPKKIVFGTGCIDQLQAEIESLGFRRLFVVTAPVIRPLIEPMLASLKEKAVLVAVNDSIKGEPTVNSFNQILREAKSFQADSVVGVGGGSVLDVAKLVAVLVNSEQEVTTLFGTGFVKAKGTWCALLPTTAGTGSEVSPNAILLDEEDELKKGIVSPYLMADAAYIDPRLTWSVPGKITAETGIDALTHCIEAFTNKFAHPVVDVYALQGIRLIFSSLRKAVLDGTDKEAREALALGSMYGGLCLGPVNTAAVHALSYPLGGTYHISHGLSNAILLPSVMRFNCEANVHKYALVALACGVEAGKDDEETARRGVEAVAQLVKDCGIPSTLTALGISKDNVDKIASDALKVQRLLKNNPREVTLQDAKAIYESLY